MSLKGLNIGDLDRKLLFENVVVSINPIGNTRSETYTTAFTLYAKKLTRPGDEIFESDQQVGLKNCEVMTRFNNLVNTQMRFLDVTDSEYYFVRDVQKNKREGYCLIKAVKRDNQ
jgi:head-tail adaptor